MKRADINKVPIHIAIMMDGNGRWAAKRKMPRTYGHKQGGKVLESICMAAYELGTRYVTFYAFSTENWKRPKEEVDGIMKLLRDYLENSVSLALKNNMRVRVIGNREKLDSDIQKSISNLENTTKSCSGLNLQLAINYGGKDEIVRAAGKLLMERTCNKLVDFELTEEIFDSYLDTSDIPEPDLFIRTGGEKRLSNFLLWEMAYTELYFTEVLWPDFDEEELKKAIAEYSQRDRRYGGLE